jgi:hypothetical protein
LEAQAREAAQEVETEELLLSQLSRHQVVAEEEWDPADKPVDLTKENLEDLAVALQKAELEDQEIQVGSLHQKEIQEVQFVDLIHHHVRAVVAAGAHLQPAEEIKVVQVETDLQMTLQDQQLFMLVVELVQVR